jgi:hypothetical protein
LGEGDVVVGLALAVGKLTSQVEIVSCLETDRRFEASGIGVVRLRDDCTSEKLASRLQVSFRYSNEIWQ